MRLQITPFLFEIQVVETTPNVMNITYETNMKEKEIRRLIKILEDTGIAELEIKKWWGERIRIVNNGVVQKAGVSDASNGKVVVVPSNSEESHVESKESSYYKEVSPMVGTFYRAPAPGEAPFVSVGDSIKTGQTLCIIEAMKVMNEIEAEISGTIMEILIDNSQPVEFNQPLFLIDESN